MATEKLRLNLDSLVAGEDLSGDQYHFVVLNASGQMELSGAGERAYGVTQDKPESGQTGVVAVSGSITKITFGDTIQPGDLLVSDADGEAIVGIIVVGGASTTVVARVGDWILGQARVSGVDGDIGEMLYQPENKVA